VVLLSPFFQQQTAKLSGSSPSEEGTIKQENFT
jgi:hypothetical protein